MTLTRRDLIGQAGAALAGAALAAAPGAASAQPQAQPRRLSAKLELFGHRGACALRPEHTLASYARAIADGADYVEPDLCVTRDGVLVARHEPNITETTDVASRPEFASRKTTKTIDGETQTGWFTDDLTLAELKSLRAIERIPKLRPANTRYNGEFEVPTFYEYLDFVAALAAARGRDIGIVPEIKHSTYFTGVGLPMEDRFLKVMADHPYTRRCPVEIQSFEVSNLKYLRSKLGRPANVRLMQLVDEVGMKPGDVLARNGAVTYGDMITPKGMAEIKTYADVVAPQVRAIIPLAQDGRLGQPTSFVADAHAAGLLVRIWTFRPENNFLAADFKGPGGDDARQEAGSVAEMGHYIAAGIDGFFTDDPALGRRAITAAGG
ncbi:MAG TPA: glycerophosphodiester phosphodiesterase [Caulobacteraceae bacterium]|jgi:glycerophosphoryl diester phosphodiesterase